MKNIELKDLYNKVYKEDAYKTFFTFLPYEESNTIIEVGGDWEGKKVLEIGCGEGDLASLMKYNGAELVCGVDFSEEAIKIAQRKYTLEGVHFYCEDYKKISNKGLRFDRIVMQGVLEHMDKPLETLLYLKKRFLAKNGDIIFSCPSFMNIRGIIWMTLQLLFQCKMSLSDIHYFLPDDISKFADKLGMRSFLQDCRYDWGNGKDLIKDFKQRLPKVFAEFKGDLDENINKYLEWLERFINNYEELNKFHLSKENLKGAVTIYRLYPRF
jgi:2-polyprenyl-3-methyl-5-hydroxy-6-metoxy-1,4-benzoquinol methylase